MRFVMYTEKTVAQALRAVNERINVPPTRSRPKMEGKTEKNGRFTISVTTPVYGRFPRKTVLQGHAERESGITVIRGSVPGGLRRNQQMLLFGILLLIGLLALAQESIILTIVAVLSGLALSVPLQGDFNNSEILLTELQKILKARFTPPKN